MCCWQSPCRQGIFLEALKIGWWSQTQAEAGRAVLGSVWRPQSLACVRWLASGPGCSQDSEKSSGSTRSPCYSWRPARLILTSPYHCFQGELHVSKLFSHPNILPYRATFIADNELWVVTSFMAYGEWDKGPGRELFWELCCQPADVQLPFSVTLPPAPMTVFFRFCKGSHLHTLHGRHE